MNLVHFAIAGSLPTPACRQLSEQPKAAVRSGGLAAGSAIPSERSVAKRQGASDKVAKAPVLMIRRWRTACAGQGEPFQCVESAYRSDRYRMIVELCS